MVHGKPQPDGSQKDVCHLDFARVPSFSEQAGFTIF